MAQHEGEVRSRFSNLRTTSFRKGHQTMGLYNDLAGKSDSQTGDVRSMMQVFVAAQALSGVRGKWRHCHFENGVGKKFANPLNGCRSSRRAIEIEKVDWKSHCKSTCRINGAMTRNDFVVFWVPTRCQMCQVTDGLAKASRGCNICEQLANQLLDQPSRKPNKISVFCS